MFVEGKSRTVFFPSDTLIYGICRDGTKNNNIRACEHLILGQFRMGARSAIYAPLLWKYAFHSLLQSLYSGQASFQIFLPKKSAFAPKHILV